MQVLPAWQTPEADIYAVVPQRLQLAKRVRAFVDFLARAFEQDHNDTPASRAGSPR